MGYAHIAMGISYSGQRTVTTTGPHGAAPGATASGGRVSP